MKKYLGTLLPLAAMLAFSSAAEARCHHKVGDWSETLRDTNGGMTLVWLHRGKSATFTARRVGTGIPDLVACQGDEDMDNCLSVKFRRNKIILGGVTYVAGCRK